MESDFAVFRDVTGNNVTVRKSKIDCFIEPSILENPAGKTVIVFGAVHSEVNKETFDRVRREVLLDATIQ